MALRLVGALGNAHDEVLIQSPYLILTDAAIGLLGQIKAGGVSLSVHTNSLSSTDSWPSYAHALRQRREMLEEIEMEIFELMPYPGHLAQVIPGHAELQDRALEQRAAASTQSDSAERGPMLSLHAKSMVIDNELAVIGSYNLDPRSEVINSEVLLAVWDEDFAHELGDAIRLDAATGNSWVVAARERGLARRVVVELAERVNAVVKGTTTLDLWPVEWSSLFELRRDREPVSRFDDEFYDCYEDVGSFPGMQDDITEVLVRLTRALTGVVRPLM